MSRRLRLEEEKARQIKDDEDEEEDKFTLWQKRINAPLVWQRTGTGFRIQDLREKHFSEAIEMIKEHYIPNEVLSRNSELKENEASVQSYLDRILFHLKDMASIMAVEENYVPEVVDEEDEKKKHRKKKKEEEIVKVAGVLVMRVIHKIDFGRVFSRVQLVQGDAMKKCVNLKSHLNRKIDIYANYKCDSFLRYYDLCVLPEYRKKGLGYEMMRSGLDVARSMGVPVVMGVFSNFLLQKLAKKLGMEVLYEVNYVEWRDSEGEMIFDDPGAGNYTCALMAGVVPAPPPREPPKPPEEEAEKKKPKVTRADKRAAVAKKKK